jgi:integrase
MPKIWYRSSKKAYYLQIDRRTQKRLGRTLKEAEAAYRQWLIDQGEALPAPQRKKLTVAEVAQEFLDHARAHTKPKTYESYCYFVVPFVERFGSVPAATFPPLSFTKWLDEHEGWKGCRRNAVIAVKRPFNWAVDQKLISESPLKSVKKPPKRRRNRVLTHEEREYVYGLIRDGQFRDFVFAMLDTGSRPGEVMSVTANHVSRGGTKWTFEEHKTAGHGEARVVYLSPAMQELTARLVALYPVGPLFRMYRGKKAAKDRYNRAVPGVKVPWTYNALRCRFKRLREKVQRLRENEPDPAQRAAIPDLSGLTSYILRHTFTTQALTTHALPVPVVSALLGHKSMKMVDEHYNHTDQATDVLREAAKKAAQKEPPAARR